ncbi:hypothetical protein DRO24_00010 [Candidatus Bathyarchaeota archaeon]|nr:MAG: hypothetical protein DRO24_00010 [Candidatus Bathyarchaeota archaeon]
MSEKTTKETHAYTPGLKVKKGMRIRKTRLLPIDGEVTVKVGDKVNFETIVARSSILGKPYIIKAYEILGVPTEVLPKLMVKKVGDIVEENEIIAKYTPFWGLIKKYVRSPIKGVIESVSDITGQIIIREMPHPIEINAYIPGEVKKIIPKRGVEIECFGAFIQGIFGIGGEKHGEICVLVDSPDDILEEDMIKNEHKGKIIVGGSLVTLDALKKAEKLGVRGIVVGGIKGQTVTDFLGYEIGVAITGHEKINTTLIITEGFGKMPMSKRVFNILKEFDGYEAAINGATQIRAGVMRPEIIIPNEKYISEVSDREIELSKGMKPGTLVRIIREPYFGKIGTVVSLPVHLQKIETESMVRVVEVELDIGKVIVPRANVEILEE